MKSNTSHLTRRRLLQAGLLPFASLFGIGSIAFARPAPIPPPASTTSITIAAVPAAPPAAAMPALPGRLYRPAGYGPFPAVVIMHGSGGLWKNDDPAQGMAPAFLEWGTLLQSKGYVALFLDSYNPRGIDHHFKSRRPCFDSNWDDATCSPAYERTKDAYRALTWLRNNPDLPLNDSKIGLLGFSQGAETALAAGVASSVTTLKSTWKVGYVKAWLKDGNGNIITKLVDGIQVPEADSSKTDYNYTVPAPYKPVADSNGFAAIVAYYPGCSFYSYFGSVTSTAAGLYMPYAPTLMMHGSADALHYANDYPAILQDKSSAQASSLGIANPMGRILYDGAEHGFDWKATIADPILWNTPAETDNQYAKRVARDDTLRHLNYYLKGIGGPVF